MGRRRRRRTSRTKQEEKKQRKEEKKDTNGGTTTWTSYRMCDHWKDKVTLPSGAVVSCSAWFDKPKTGETWYLPDVGIYFASSWDSIAHIWTTPGWDGPEVGPKAEIAIVNWADHGLPSNEELTINTIKYGLEQAKLGREVDIGCVGAHGRTGTALAAMLILDGMEHKAAKEWVWTNYCQKAIESKSQEKFLAELDRDHNGRTVDLEEFTWKPVVTTKAGQDSYKTGYRKGATFRWSNREQKMMWLLPEEADYHSKMKWEDEKEKDEQEKKELKKSVSSFPIGSNSNKNDSLDDRIDKVLKEYQEDFLEGDEPLTIDDLGTTCQEWIRDLKEDVSNGLMEEKQLDGIIVALLEHQKYLNEIDDKFLDGSKDSRSEYIEWWGGEV